MSDRGKLLRRPWSIQDVMREKRAAEKRKQIVEKFRLRYLKPDPFATPACRSRDLEMSGRIYEKENVEKENQEKTS